MVQESISGFEEDGTWEDVVEHGQRITDVLEDEEVEGTDFEDWEDWRPKAREEISREMTDKTAGQVSADPEDDDSGVKKVAKKVFGTFEKAVYRNVMGRSGPLYFDSDLISARIEKSSGVLRGREKFTFEVDVHDLNLKEKIRKALT